MTSKYTPQDKSAANVRHRMQSFGETISNDKSRSAAVRTVYGSSLTNTVHQNYASVIRELKDQLDTDSRRHLSVEVLQSAMRGLVSAAMWDRVENFYFVLADCESPAEELFAIALDTVLATKSIAVYFKTKKEPEPDDAIFDALQEEEHIFVEVEPQGEVWPKDRPVSWKTRPYRADFLITCVKKTGDSRTPVTQSKMAIEIDGRVHATDESRSHDNERDRVFRELGIATDRYTGVDILTDPFACAQRAVDHFLAL